MVKCMAQEHLGGLRWHDKCCLPLPGGSDVFKFLIPCFESSHYPQVSSTCSNSWSKSHVSQSNLKKKGGEHPTDGRHVWVPALHHPAKLWQSKFLRQSGATSHSTTTRTRWSVSACLAQVIMLTSRSARGLVTLCEWADEANKKTHAATQMQKWLWFLRHVQPLGPKLSPSHWRDWWDGIDGI